eukprot:gene5554-7675_t
MNTKITIVISLVYNLLLIVTYCCGARVAIVGGGAAGIFSAVHCADKICKIKSFVNEVVVLESGSTPLSKVLISGGGRCNVMHDPRKSPNEISKGYPRGNRELLGPFKSTFGPSETYDWFSNIAQVDLKTEPDGRVFPVSDRSSTIADALLQAASKYNVDIRCGNRVMGIQLIKGSDDDHNSFNVTIKSNDRGDYYLICDKLIIATGSARPFYKIIESFGHSISNPLPSLFSFKLDYPQLTSLSGVSNSITKVKIVIPSVVNHLKELIRPNRIPSYSQIGPMLITKQGLSGPAILKLSSFGAKLLAAMDYKFDVEINFLGELSYNDILEHLLRAKELYPN